MSESGKVVFVKILQKGNEIEHTIRCGRCRAELSITTDDIVKADPHDEYSTKGHVVCPVCGNVIKTYNGQFNKASTIVKDDETGDLIKI